MASEVDICNMALTGLGANRIISLSEDTENARRCTTVFDLYRDEMLREHPWNFAIKRVGLALLATSPVYEFDNAFQIPGDVLKILSIEAEDTNFFVEWRIEGDTVVSNESSINIRYVSRVEDTTLWDSAFVSVFAARLEAELAYPLTNSRSLSADKFEVYNFKLRKAKAMDAQENSQEELQADLWVQSRGSSDAYLSKKLTIFP